MCNLGGNNKIANRCLIAILLMHYLRDPVIIIGLSQFKVVCKEFEKAAENRYKKRKTAGKTG